MGLILVPISFNDSLLETNDLEMTHSNPLRWRHAIPVRTAAFVLTSFLARVSLATAPPPAAADLARMVTEPGEITTVTSTQSDPVGKAGLWGMVAHFVVPHGCEYSYRVIGDIERYPERIKKVKRVEVLKRSSDSLLTSYTEAEMGFQMTSTMLFTFYPKARTIISKAVGKTDRVTWSKTLFENVGSDNYCRIEFRAFADVSWVPDFILNWGLSMALKELASTYRNILDSALHSSQNTPQGKVPLPGKHK